MGFCSENRTAIKNKTPIDYGVLERNYHHAYCLLEHGADPCISGPESWSPIHLAAVGTKIRVGEETERFAAIRKCDVRSGFSLASLA